MNKVSFIQAIMPFAARALSSQAAKSVFSKAVTPTFGKSKGPTTASNISIQPSVKPPSVPKL